MRRLALLRITTLPFQTLATLAASETVPLLESLLDVEDRLARTMSGLEIELHAAAGGKTEENDPARARARLSLISLKRDVHNRRAIGEESLRQAEPLLSAGTLEALRAYEVERRRALEIAEAVGAAYRNDLSGTRADLVRKIGAPLVQEGIRLASRSLLGRVRALARHDPRALACARASSWSHDERHVAAKAAAYLARFCTKTSPNGVFCGTSLTWIGEGPLAVAGEPGIDRVDVLLNVFEAGKVAACLAVDPDLDAAIVPRPNSTLREIDGGWTWWKFASLRNTTEKEVLCRVRSNPILGLFIEEAGRERLRASDLIDAVAARCDVGREDLEGFYRGLVERGILIAEIEIPYSSRRPLLDLAAACRAAGRAPAWLKAIEDIERSVDEVAAMPPESRIQAMDRIGAALEALPHNRALVHDELFRVDAVTSLEVRLPDRVIADLEPPLRIYMRLLAAMYPASFHRSAFVERFLKDHSPDTDVPILDLYHGFVEPEEEDGRRPVAFPEPSAAAEPGSEESKAAAARKRIREFLRERAAGSGLRGEGGPASGSPRGEIHLDDEAVAALVGETPEPRWSCGALFQIAASSASDLDEGRYRLVLSAVFNGAGLALARFHRLHGGGTEGRENPVVRELERAWRCVEREGAIVAEMTYNHRARTANAGLRPSIFRHEIEMPGEKATPGAVVIPLRDLRVRYETSQARFVLASESLGKEIIPVISSGVDPVGICSFLVSVGYQSLHPVGYLPGFDVEGVTHWPRVVCGKVVLFRERWVFRSGEWPGTSRSGAALSDADYFVEAARWRRRHGLPRNVFVHTSEESKPRYVDLEAPIFVDLLRRAAASLAGKKSPTLHVTEMCPAPGDLWITDASGGRYASEFLVQLQGP